MSKENKDNELGNWTPPLSDRELIQEILACLRVNMLRRTITTTNDAHFLDMIQAWSEGKSAPKSSLGRGSPPSSALKASGNSRRSNPNHDENQEMPV
jgi:hypothetical protein